MFMMIAYANEFDDPNNEWEVAWRQLMMWIVMMIAGWLVFYSLIGGLILCVYWKFYTNLRDRVK